MRVGVGGGTSEMTGDRRDLVLGPVTTSSGPTTSSLGMGEDQPKNANFQDGQAPPVLQG